MMFLWVPQDLLHTVWHAAIRRLMTTESCQELAGHDNDTSLRAATGDDEKWKLLWRMNPRWEMDLNWLDTV